MSDLSEISRQEAKAAGLRLYMTGLPCKHGHIAQRYVVDSSCAQCKDLSVAVWRANNRDKIRERQRALYAANPEIFLQRDVKRRAENPDLFKKQRALRKQKNPNAGKEYYAATRDARLAKARAWRKIGVRGSRAQMGSLPTTIFLGSDAPKATSAPIVEWFSMVEAPWITSPLCPVADRIGRGTCSWCVGVAIAQSTARTLSNLLKNAGFWSDE